MVCKGLCLACSTCNSTPQPAQAHVLLQLYTVQLYSVYHAFMVLQAWIGLGAWMHARHACTLSKVTGNCCVIGSTQPSNPQPTPC